MTLPELPTLPPEVTNNPVYCRIYQNVMQAASYVMPWRTPKVLADYSELADELRAHNVTSVLVVADPGAG